MIEIDLEKIKKDFYEYCNNVENTNFGVDRTRPAMVLFDSPCDKISGWIKVFETKQNREDIILNELIQYLNAACKNKIIHGIDIIQSSIDEKILILIFIPNLEV